MQIYLTHNLICGFYVREREILFVHRFQHYMVELQWRQSCTVLNNLTVSEEESNLDPKQAAIETELDATQVLNLIY